MSRKAVKTVAIVIAAVMVITTLSCMMFLSSSFGAESAAAATTVLEQKYLNEKMKELEYYFKLIHDNYKDEVDYETLVNGAFEGAMYSLGDPYSVFFTDNSEGQGFVEGTIGEYEGIGVTMSVNGDGFCEVVSVTPKAPADKAGIKVGDVIVKVDGQDVTKKSLDEISAMAKGKAGTNVTLSVTRAGKEMTFAMTRETIKVVSVYPEMLEGNIGYILLTGFETGAAKEFKKAKDDLIKKGAKSLIIDIRNNPGGLMDTVVEIADGLIAKGDITHLKDRVGIFETVSATPKDIEKVPMALLINEYSASASEVLAGALKDNKAAVLVGTTTYGKGVAQIIGYTKDKQVYKVSVYYFLTPDKHDIQGVGVAPDYPVRNSLGEFRAAAAELYRHFAPFAENTKPKPGDTGLNVFAAQQRLALLGFSLEVNATMDEATVAAVKRFQSEQGLYAYGTLDLTTMRKIEEVAVEYVTNDSKEDMQLKKAIELLKKGL
ncbi:MAG: S41 family peptidase [Clostridiales bacterium]|nr:S41 family peptidase [Clostridiales bacterium]